METVYDNKLRKDVEMRNISKVFAYILALCIGIMTLSTDETTAAAAAQNQELEETVLFTGSAEGARWKVATSIYTTNSYGSFNPYLISEDGYFYVEYKGKQGSVALVLVEATTPVWGSVMPSKSGKTKSGYYSIFRYRDLVEAYGSDDFSDLDVIHISGGAVAVTVKSLKWIGKPLVNDLGADSMIFQGSSTVSKINRMLVNFYTRHAGGSFDASVINKGSYLYLEYTGAEDGVYLACSSSSGGKRWAVVKASENGVSESGKSYSIFKYEDLKEAYGTDFGRLDHIYVYSAADTTVTLKRIAYFAGKETPSDQSDGSWDRSYEGIALLGDSIIENPMLYYGDWNTLLGRNNCDNWGIGGQTTKEIEARIDDMLKGSYDKIVILCGTNDIGHWMKLSETMANYRSMFDKISKALPNAKVYMVSILPPSPAGKQETQDTIRKMNTAIKKLAAGYDSITYVDCYSKFVDEEGNSIGDYFSDTVHPNEKGYEVICGVLLPYLSD